MNDPSTRPAAGWYPDPAGGPGLRYWDGTTWTAHTAGPTPALPNVRPPGAPSPVGIWVTAVLSVVTFWLHTSSGTSETTIALPIGLLFMAWCLWLVGRTKVAYARVGAPVPSHVNVARIVAIVLGALSVLNALATMANGN